MNSKIKKLNLIINIYIYKIVFNLFYPIKFLILRNKITKKYEANNNVIVSLTSIPSRIKTLHYVIESMLCQSERPSKIILWLSSEDFGDNYKFPKSLTRLLSSNFEIRWCDNLKPHKKYFYTMKENRNSIVITIDDDVFYRKNLIRDLLYYSKQFPDKVICTRGHRIKLDYINNKISDYNDWDYEVKDFLNPSHLICATGVGGVLYPANCFSDELFNVENIKKLCLNADDLWLKAMEIIDDKQVVIIPSKKNSYVVGIFNSEKSRLSIDNVNNSNNDVVFKKINDNYKLYDKLVKYINK